MTRFLSGTLWAAVIVLLAGCGSTGPVPIDTYYVLPNPSANAGPRLTDGIIRVRPFAASDLYRTRAVLYSEADDFAIRQHHYHFWSDSPPRMLQAMLGRYLRESDAAGLVATTPPGRPVDYEIIGTVQAFERRLRGGLVTVRVGLELRLEDARNGSILLVDDYQEDIRIGSLQVENSVGAFAEATTGIFHRFLDNAREVVGAGG